MSKVQGKESDLLNNLANTEIASELDARLRDLEKNIAVAREFIKLADESYSQLRHNWNLLQQDSRTGKTELETTEISSSPKRNESRSRSGGQSKKIQEKESRTEESRPKESKTSKSRGQFRKRSEKSPEDSETPGESLDSQGPNQTLRSGRKHKKEP